MDKIQIETITVNHDFTGTESSFVGNIELTKPAYKMIVKRVRFTTGGAADTDPKIIRCTNLTGKTPILTDFTPGDFTTIDYIHQNGPYRSGNYTFKFYYNDESTYIPANTAKVAITLEFHEYI